MKKYISFLVLLLLLQQQNIFAQSNKVDSLQLLLRNTSDSKTKVDILNKLSQLMPTSDSLLAKSIYLSQKVDYEEGLTKAYSILSNKLTDEGKYDSALTINFLNLKKRKESKPSHDLASIYSSVGLLYDYKGDYQNALIYFLKGLTVSEALGDKKHISNFYNRIGIIYNYQRKYDKSLEYFDKSLELRKEINDEQGQAEIYNNMGIIYRKKNDTDKAIEYYTKGLKLKEELDFDKSSTASSYNNLGTAYFYKNDYNRALEYYKKSLKIKLEENLTNDLASTYINIGETYTHLKDYKYALKNIEQGIVISKKLGNRDDIMLGYEELAQAYAGMNDFKNAHKNHVLYADLKDSIFNTESDQRIIEMQTKYEVEKKEQEIKLLQKENEIKRIETKNSDFIRNVSVIGFIIISFLVIAIIKSYRDDLEKNKLLNLNKVKIESQNSVLKEMSHEKDQLMKIFAHDFRSPLNQIDGLINLVTFSDENLSSEQKEALSNVTQATEHSRQLINKILTTKSIDISQLNVNIEKIDIKILIQKLIDEQKINAKNKHIDIHLETSSEETKALADTHYTEQIFENLLSNALKFSPYNKNIYIKITDTAQSIKVEIKDEGPGFTEDDKKRIFGVFEKLSATPTGGEKSTGLGLSIVKKYVEIIKVWCKSQKGHGATFIVELNKS